MKKKSIEFNYFSAIKFLSKYVKVYRKNFLKFYVGWLMDSVLTILLPILFGIMIDEIVYYQNVASFVKIAIVFLVCIIFACGLYFLIYAQHGYLMNMFTFSIRYDLFRHLQKLNAQNIADVSTGEFIAILQDYPIQCMHFIIRNVIHSFNGVLMIFLYEIYLLRINWKIGLIALGATLFTIALNMRFEKKARELGDVQRKKNEDYVGWLYEILTALQDIRMLGCQDRVNKIFDKNQEIIYKASYKINLHTLSAQNIVSGINLATRLIIYVLIALMAFEGKITIGMVIIVLTFFDKVVNKIIETNKYFLDAQNRVSYVKKVCDFLHLSTEQMGREKLNIKNGEINFVNVSFRYPEHDFILKNISFIINPGEHVAIVGKSGCGKTTLAYLLMGFYHIRDGYISIDDQKLRDCELKSIRKEIGYVSQDVQVFDGTIRDNLLMGNLNAQEDSLIEAYTAAGLKDLIDSLPLGINTVIGKEGIGLSGGQKQRIAIARIYLKNPSIVIFDEATSALDSETEMEIHSVWKRLLRGKTAIIIAHKLSSVMQCDKVLLFESGEIVETGVPENLVKKSYKFKELFNIQG